MKNLTIAVLVAFSVTSFAQSDEDKIYFHDISFDNGLFASLNSAKHENLVGWKYSFQTTFYSITNFGIRSGFSFINDLEGTDNFYQVPIHVVYRTAVDKSFYMGGTVHSIEDLLFKILLGLVPRQAEYYGGINIGYIKPDNNISLTSNDGVEWYKEGYTTQRRFVTTLDLGLRLNYKIRRFAVSASPYVSYILSDNFKYYSDLGFDNGYKPRWFMNISIGLSYQF